METQTISNNRKEKRMTLYETCLSVLWLFVNAIAVLLLLYSHPKGIFWEIINDIAGYSFMNLLCIRVLMILHDMYDYEAYLNIDKKTNVVIMIMAAYMFQVTRDYIDKKPEDCISYKS